MGLSQQRKYFRTVAPWKDDPPEVQVAMAAAVTFEINGDQEKADRFLEKAIAASA